MKDNLLCIIVSISVKVAGSNVDDGTGTAEVDAAACTVEDADGELDAGTKMEEDVSRVLLGEPDVREWEASEAGVVEANKELAVDSRDPGDVEDYE